jgi:hypothetical protein
LIRIADPVSRGIIPRDFLNEECSIGSVLTLATNDICEVRLKDIVTKHQHEIVVDMLLSSQQCVSKPLLFALVCIRDWDVFIHIPVVIDDYLFKIANNYNKLVCAKINKLIKTMCK